jgi:D-alanine--poly(phosphoribitol) ligase subunit 2
MIERERISAVVRDAVEELNAGVPDRIDVEAGDDARLYGEGGPLDSLGLVSLVAAVEEGVQLRYGRTVTLADERAVSQRSSPFRTVGSLVDYIVSQLSGPSA